MPHIATIQVGLPQTLGTGNATDPMDQPWSTGFFKAPIQGHVWLGQTHLEGDGQADLKNHGGIDKAVLAYSADHYDYWRWPSGPVFDHRTFSAPTCPPVPLAKILRWSARPKRRFALATSTPSATPGCRYRSPDSPAGNSLAAGARPI